MTQADFSERQYELAVNLELLAGTGAFFVPSQRNEKQLGYDIAAAPAMSVIWSVIGRSPPPTGYTAKRTRRGVSQPELPRVATSLFLQYKRPEYLYGATARERSARLARSLGVPYFRFVLERDQHETLKDLADNASPRAEVCYSAGGFVSRRTLQRHQAARHVIKRSEFVKVAGLPRFAPGSVHAWTYSGPGSGGLLCSQPERLNGLDGETLLRATALTATLEPRPPQEHLTELGESVEKWAAASDVPPPEYEQGPVEREQVRLLEKSDEQILDLAELSDEQRQMLDTAVSIQLNLSRADVNWLLVAGWPSDRSAEHSED